ncbi:hypothetical protein C2G38_2188904 [Gigaspora rosea]|uniref:BTB domain-containing protein n=1 Tax=Gigaspora rosea TaxID=44941 RepID=A0A397V4G4_9GLOM|nr:hypothetical protein C2G38_2188904 [Gigaspora rosea]
MMIKFYDKLSQDFSKLLESEYNYDTIIEVGEQPNIKLFKAYSVVLYQRSLYFQSKLTDIKKNNIINIKLPHISDKIFNIILKYIYGSIISLENIDASGIMDLLIAFNEFNISEFVEYLQSCLIDDNINRLIYDMDEENKFVVKFKFCVRKQNLDLASLISFMFISKVMQR